MSSTVVVRVCIPEFACVLLQGSLAHERAQNESSYHLYIRLLYILVAVHATMVTEHALKCVRNAHEYGYQHIRGVTLPWDVPRYLRVSLDLLIVSRPKVKLHPGYADTHIHDYQLDTKALSHAEADSKAPTYSLS
ncbi:hypothetical protein FGB62_331g01 [Gracilaria domingensis]|nr:hypothetical protein FGB62_331g01 [Gracilaria domingensis]